MSTELKEFGDIVARMMCPDNDSRSSAEKLYESIAVAQRGSLLFHLYHQKSAGVEVIVLFISFVATNNMGVHIIQTAQMICVF
jgi:hypothetical protein